MEARARSMTTWRQLIRRAVVLLALWSGASGCVGPNAVRYTRLRYNEVLRDTNDQQLLLNIVRLRYADSPVFIDLPNITSQFEVAGRGNYLGGAGNQFRGQTNLAWIPMEEECPNENASALPENPGIFAISASWSLCGSKSYMGGRREVTIVIINYAFGDH